MTIDYDLLAESARIAAKADADLITDLKVINGGWRATLRDGATIEVTDKEAAWAGCAQDAVLIKARDRNIESAFGSAAEYEKTGWQDFIYCGLRSSAYSESYEALVDAGDLNEDPLPGHRAAAGRVMAIGGVLVGCANVRVTRASTGEVLTDLAYADAQKRYAVVLVSGLLATHYNYARIDGLDVQIDRM